MHALCIRMALFRIGFEMNIEYTGVLRKPALYCLFLLQKSHDQNHRDGVLPLRKVTP